MYFSKWKLLRHISEIACFSFSTFGKNTTDTNQLIFQGYGKNADDIYTIKK